MSFHRSCWLYNARLIVLITSIDFIMNTTDSSSQTNMDINPHKYYENRLNTFEHWPKQMLPDKYALARSGFFYTGCGDKVKCFSCGQVIGDWERTDDAWKEHVKWGPRCEFVKMVGGQQGFDFPEKPRGVGDGANAISNNSAQTFKPNFSPRLGFGESKNNELFNGLKKTCLF